MSSQTTSHSSAGRPQNNTLDLSLHWELRQNNCCCCIVSRAITTSPSSLSERRVCTQWMRKCSKLAVSQCGHTYPVKAVADGSTAVKPHLMQQYPYIRIKQLLYAILICLRLWSYANTVVPWLNKATQTPIHYAIVQHILIIINHLSKSILVFRSLMLPSHEAYHNTLIRQLIFASLRLQFLSSYTDLLTSFSWCVLNNHYGF